MSKLITDTEAAEILCLTARQVSRLARRDDLPHVNLPNGELRFDPEDLRAWIESLKRPATAAGGNGR
jgi:hypothetical protein